MKEAAIYLVTVWLMWVATVVLIFLTGCTPLPRPTATPPAAAMAGLDVLTGVVEHVVVDHGFTADRDLDLRTDLEQADGTRVPLVGLTPEQAETGSEVRVQVRSGVAALTRGGQAAYVVERFEVLTPLPLRLNALDEPRQLAGTDRTLVVVVTVDGGPTWPPDGATDMAAVRELVLGETGAAGYLRAASHGAFGLAGDVTGPHTIANPGSSCDYALILNRARDAARSAGLDPNGYSRHVVFFYPSLGCSWWGLGTIGGNPAWALVTYRYRKQVVVHELGHNLGLLHAHGLACPVGVTRGSLCSPVEYGDTIDVMGGGIGSFACPQLLRLGWLDAPGMPPVVRSGVEARTVSLAPLGTGTLAGARCLALTTPAGERFYVEHRQPTAHDQFSPATGSLDGFSVRYDHGDGRNFTGVTLPETTSTWDMVYRLGRSFVDGALRVTPVALGSDLTVAVGDAPPPGTPTPTPQPATPTPTATRTPQPGVWSVTLDCERVRLRVQTNGERGEEVRFHVLPAGPTRRDRLDSQGRAAVTIAVDPEDTAATVTWRGETRTLALECGE